MASIIRLNIGTQEPFKEYRSIKLAIRSAFTRSDASYIRPIIAKGNIIEGIEAKA